MERAGIQKAMLTLAAGLKEEGHKVFVATMYDKDRFIPKLSKDYNIDIINLNMRSPIKWRITDLYRLSRGLWRLVIILKSNKIDLIQTFSRFSNWIGPFAGWMAGVPLRISSQRNSNRKDRNFFHKIDAFIANSPLVHKMTTVSEATRKFSIETVGIRAEKMVTIRNDIDYDAYSGSEITHTDKARLMDELNLHKSNIIITLIGRLQEQKGHEILINAIPCIASKHNNARFLIVGEGPDMAHIKKIVSSRNLDMYVRFTGSRSDVPAILSVTSIVVLPSLWEGLPNILLEAMAAGVPVVASDVDGCSEIVVHESTGLLVEPGSSDALAKAIISLIDFPCKREDMGNAAKKTAQDKFKKGTTTKKYLELYEELLRN